ncbi:uncharacterized protein LOC131681177 [Topomyia yanbarensis]|uniref:uncharacterized protein LOC131681177 n=1 Tax=Topomyia yanbarensis TaxID=2498891 RepID=UPI00273AE4B2|nr:uncharacterized protein LOC131681177 [Topomyia yanbarensis]
MQCLVLVTIFILSVKYTFVSAIQVHENPIENTTELISSTLKSTLPNGHVLSGSVTNVTNTQPVETSDSELSSDGRKSTTKNVVTTTASTDYSIGKQTKQQAANSPKHSSSYRDTPLLVMPTVSTPASASTSPLSPGGSSGSSFKEDSTLKNSIGSDLVQHPISGGYKKRQLFSSAFRHPATKNDTDDRSYSKKPIAHILTKEFVPSPELVQIYSAVDYHNGRNIHQVDAPYPANGVDNDSRWFGGNHLHYPAGLGAEIRTEKPIAHNWPAKWEHNKNGKFLWLPNGQFPFGGSGGGGGPDSDSPISKHNSKLPSPKGKWKWVPEEENEPTGQGESPVENGQVPDIENKIVSGPHHHLLKFPSRDRPYSFDNAVGSQVSPFSGNDGGGISPDEPGSTVNSGQDIFSGGVGTNLQTSGKGDEALTHISPWKKIIHVLTAAIPIGLIISALTPKVVYINPNMTQIPAQMQTPTPISGTGGSFTNAIRQRSEDDDGGINPLFGLLNALSVGHVDPSRLSLPPFTAGSGCEEKSFCELARYGTNHDADVLSKMLWKIANETPSDRARQSGLEELFRAIKDNDCSRFRCENT